MAQQTHTMHVMVEAATGVMPVQRVENALAAVSERSVAHIMGQRDGFGKRDIQPQGGRHFARDAAYELQVERATGKVVVLVEGKHLRLIHAAIVEGVVQYAIHIAHECGTHQVDIAQLFRRSAVAPTAIAFINGLRMTGGIRRKLRLFKLEPFAQVRTLFVREREETVLFCLGCHSVRLLSMARPRVTSSANSRSPPTGSPLARRVTFTPRGFIRRAR